MADQIDPGVTDQCRALLTAATQRNATIDDVAALFSGQPDAKVYDAANQLSLAGLLT